MEVGVIVGACKCWSQGLAVQAFWALLVVDLVSVRVAVGVRRCF